MQMYFNIIMTNRVSSLPVRQLSTRYENVNFFDSTEVSGFLRRSSYFDAVNFETSQTL